MTTPFINDLTKCSICSHIRRVHDRTEATEQQYEHMCWGCWDNFQSNKRNIPIYHLFKQDNLDLIEKIYDEGKNK